MSKPVAFDQDEVALCPNGHGPMLMVDQCLPMTETVVKFESYWLVTIFNPIPEARAHCLGCRHTMIVADERE